MRVASTENQPYLALVDCFNIDPEGVASSEAVVIDVMVERPQRPVNDIRHTERIAVVFEAADRGIPEVLALRSDFPWVPHVNLSPFKDLACQGVHQWGA